jgi:2,5-diketo-D-gluconate reductase B
MSDSVKTKEVQGVEVPTLGLGTWRLDGDDCVEAVAHALEIGYRHVDTAQMYGNEEAVGRGIARSGVPRDEIWLTTKVWMENAAFDDVLRSTEASLRRLDVEHVDLLLLHWPNESVPLSETLSAMRRIQDDGAARHLGVSNFPPDLLDEALDEAEILCNQVEYHPFLSQDHVLEICHEWDLLLTAYSPLARGRVSDDPTLRSIAEAHGRTPAQVTLRWLVQQDQVAAIPKAATPEHRRANLEVFDFELTGDEMEAIHGLSRGERIVDPEFAPDWRATGSPS